MTLSLNYLKNGVFVNIAGKVNHSVLQFFKSSATSGLQLFGSKNVEDSK